MKRAAAWRMTSKSFSTSSVIQDNDDRVVRDVRSAHSRLSGLANDKIVRIDVHDGPASTVHDRREAVRLAPIC
jgi:hypothetical protein